MTRPGFSGSSPAREGVLYLLRVAAPFAGLFLLAPLSVVPALPALAANLLSDASYMRSLDYHYLTSVVPFLMVGAIDAAAFLAALAGAARGAARVAREGRDALPRAPRRWSSPLRCWRRWRRATWPGARCR